MSGAESLSDPTCGVGCEVVEASIPRGGAEPTHNQLSGAVGGRAWRALISIVEAALRAVFGGGSFADGCRTAAQPVPWRCLRLFAAGGWLLAAYGRTEPPPAGGEGAGAGGGVRARGGLGGGGAAGGVRRPL